MIDEDKIPSFTKHECQIISEKSNYKEFLCIKKGKYQISQFDKQEKLTLEREYLDAKKVVAVLLVDLMAKQIVLIEQFRAGAIKDPDSPWLLEIVAGMQDRDEDNFSLAEREVKEETGCEFKTLIPIYEYWASPGISNEQVSLYCGLVESPESGIFGCKNEDENIKTHIIDFEKAFRWVKTGRIKNATTLIALQWLQLNLGDLTDTSVNNYY